LAGFCGVNCEHLDMCEVFNRFYKWVTFNEDMDGWMKANWPAGEKSWLKKNAEGLPITIYGQNMNQR